MTMAMSIVLIFMCSFSMAMALPVCMALAMELRDELRHAISPTTRIRLTRNGIQTAIACENISGFMILIKYLAGGNKDLKMTINSG